MVASVIWLMQENTYMQTYTHMHIYNIAIINSQIYHELQAVVAFLQPYLGNYEKIFLILL